MTAQVQRGAPPSGRQYEIGSGAQHAVVVEVGGGIRVYEVDGRPVLDPYPVDAMVDGAHGTPLVPWPNRLRDGRYRFDGAEYQLPLTEPENHNAIHGLLRWRAWRPVEVSADRVEMGIRLHPVPGYPFALDVRIAYHLTADGLTVSTTATNVGGRTAPYGYGQHPYLSPGAGAVDDCTLRLPAATRIPSDDRGLPAGHEPVEGTRSTSARAGRWAHWRSTRRSPTSSGTATAGRPRHSPAPTGAPPSCGSATPTVTSRSSRATRSHPTVGAAGWAASR